MGLKVYLRIALKFYILLRYLLHNTVSSLALRPLQHSQSKILKQTWR